MKAIIKNTCIIGMLLSFQSLVCFSVYAQIKGASLTRANNVQKAAKKAVEARAQALQKTINLGFRGDIGKLQKASYTRCSSFCRNVN